MESNYPKYQVTWAKGEVNFTFRDDEDWKPIMKQLQKAVMVWGKWVGSQDTVSGMKPTEATSNEEIVGKCPECNSDLIFFSGKSKKTGKPFQAHKCTNDKCEHIKWL